MTARGEGFEHGNGRKFWSAVAHITKNTLQSPEHYEARLREQFGPNLRDQVVNHFRRSWGMFDEEQMMMRKEGWWHPSAPATMQAPAVAQQPSNQPPAKHK